MIRHYDQNLDDAVLLQASRPIGRLLAWILALVLGALLLAYGAMVWGEDGKKKKKRRDRAEPPAVTQPRTGN